MSLTVLAVVLAFIGTGLLTLAVLTKPYRKEVGR